MTRAAAVLVSAGLYGLAFPPFECAPLAFVALVPLVLALRGRGAAQAAALAGGWAFAATLFVIAWVVPTVTGHFEYSWPAGVAFLALLALFAAAPFHALVFAAVAAGAQGARRAPLFALAWVAAEYLRTHLGLESPWAKLGDTQFESERLRQVADLAGIYGVGGLVAFANAAGAELIAAGAARLRDARAPLRPALGAAAAAAALVAGALAYGGARRAEHAPAPSGFEVALVQGNVAAELRWHRATASHVLRRYGGLTRDLLRASGAEPPDLVIWPENAIQTPPDDPVYGPPLAKLAARVPLLLGAPRSEVRDGARLRFNSVLLLRPDGAAESYDKRRLLPFSETRPFGRLGSLGTRGNLDAERYDAGSEPGLFHVAGRTLGVLICMEAVYPDLAREAVAAGATVLVNPSNDGWYRGAGGARQHLGQVVFRAVETRTPMLRATPTGVTAVIAPDGSLAAALAAGTTGVLRAVVPDAASTPTPYVRTGDLFARACVGACALAAAAAAASRRRSAPGASRAARR